MIINDDSIVISKCSFKLNDDTRIIIDDCNMFVIQAIRVVFTTLNSLCNLQMGPIS